MKLQHCFLSLSLITSLTVLSSCTSIAPSSESVNVTLVKAFNVNGCNKLGTTKANVTEKIGVITRGEETISKELITVAKNRAAIMGGDSIVAHEPVVDGSMSFDIYKCAE